MKQSQSLNETLTMLWKYRKEGKRVGGTNNAIANRGKSIKLDGMSNYLAKCILYSVHIVYI